MIQLYHILSTVNLQVIGISSAAHMEQTCYELISYN